MELSEVVNQSSCSPEEGSLGMVVETRILSPTFSQIDKVGNRLFVFMRKYPSQYNIGARKKDYMDYRVRGGFWSFVCIFPIAVCRVWNFIIGFLFFPFFHVYSPQALCVRVTRNINSTFLKKDLGGRETDKSQRSNLLFLAIAPCWKI